MYNGAQERPSNTAKKKLQAVKNLAASKKKPLCWFVAAALHWAPLHHAS